MVQTQVTCWLKYVHAKPLLPGTILQSGSVTFFISIVGANEGKGRMALQSNHQNAHGQSGRYAATLALRVQDMSRKIMTDGPMGGGATPGKYG